MKRSAVAVVVLSVLALSFLAACGSTDVVAKVAKSSFAAVAAASKDRVSDQVKAGAWTLSSAAGDLVSFSKDFSAAGSDVEFSLDVRPFLDAGLDATKLSFPAGISYSIDSGRLLLGFELGADKFPEAAATTFASDFAQIVGTQRTRVGYHEKLDHYGIKLGGGNMFEWAKDMTKNDKDIVWVLNPEPFIAAGVDPSKVGSWIFAKVESKDPAGKTVLEDKLLNPFDL